MTFPHNDSDDIRRRNSGVLSEAEYAAWRHRWLPRITWAEWQRETAPNPLMGPRTPTAKRKGGKGGDAMWDESKISS